MSLRRSSRARAAQSFAVLFSYGNSQGPAGTSSNGSAGSSRAEGSARMASKNKIRREDSDLDMDDIDPDVKDEDDDDDDDDEDNILDEDDDEEEEEETTRCICGSLEYPGPPPIDSATHSGGGSGSGGGAGGAGSGGAGGRQAKNRSASGTVSSARSNADSSAEEPGSLFIQCDSCKVWQHGGCVGIMDEGSTPDEYYCEKCRPDFHHLGKASNSQRYSKYRPIQDIPKSQSKTKKNSTTPSKNSAKSARERDRDRNGSKAPKPSAEPGRRRSTMNSRAVYEDDETLRRIIEESKSDIQPPHLERESRRAKRAREEAEDTLKTPSKRFRTRSQSPRSTTSHSPTGSIDEDEQRSGKSRSVSSRTQRQKQRERNRVESFRQRNRESLPPEQVMTPPQERSNSPTKNEDPGSPASEKKIEESSPSSRQNGSANAAPVAPLTRKGRQPRQRNANARSHSAAEDSTESRESDDKDKQAKVNPDEGDGVDSTIATDGANASSLSVAPTSNGPNGNAGGGGDITQSRPEFPLNGTNSSGDPDAGEVDAEGAVNNSTNSTEDGAKTAPNPAVSNSQIAHIQVEAPSASQSSTSKRIPQTPVGPGDFKSGLRGLDANTVSSILNGTAVVGSGGGGGGGGAGAAASGSAGRRKGREKNGMTELKKRATFMFEYISRVQLEMAQRSESTDGAGSNLAAGTSAATTTRSFNSKSHHRQSTPKSNGVSGGRKSNGTSNRATPFGGKQLVASLGSMSSEGTRSAEGDGDDLKLDDDDDGGYGAGDGDGEGDEESSRSRRMRRRRRLQQEREKDRSRTEKKQNGEAADAPESGFEAEAPGRQDGHHEVKGGVKKDGVETVEQDSGPGNGGVTTDDDDDDSDDADELDELMEGDKGNGKNGGADGGRDEDDDDGGGLTILTEDQLAAFSSLGTTEMMDILARKLVLWQQEFGKVSER